MADAGAVMTAAAAATLATAAALAGAAFAQTPPALSVTPNPATAGRAFVLTLTGIPSDGCYTTFERESVMVAGARIDLLYTSVSRPVDSAPLPCVLPVAGAPEPVPNALSGDLPRFAMPALRAGRYEVWATHMPECLMGIPRCAIAQPAPVSAGILEVLEDPAAGAGWHLQEPTALAGAPFRMRLVRDGLPVCTGFSHAEAPVSANVIYASFLMQVGKCAALSPDPLGPGFDMPALKTGIYPVHAIELLPCEVAQPACAVDRLPSAAVDTLVVVQTLAARTSPMRSRAPAVRLRGNTLFIVFSGAPSGRAGAAIADGAGRGSGPAASGAWTADLMSPDGRVLESAGFRGGPGLEAALPFRHPPTGLNLVRLTAPDGSIHSIPFVR